MSGTAARTALLVIPANNTTLAPEMAALLPGFDRQIVARVPRPARTLTAEDIPAYAAATITAAAAYLPDRPDLVIYGCTAAGFLAGPEGNRQMTDRLAERFNVPVVSTADAMIDVLRNHGAVRIAVVTPYLQPVNDGLVAYLATAGIAVDTLNSFECQTTDALGQVTAEEVAALARQTARPDHDALFIACSQLPTLDILAPLRRSLGIPVWSSIAATAWAASRATHAASNARAA